jgi:hypothetical protein
MCIVHIMCIMHIQTSREERHSADFHRFDDRTDD